MYKDIQSQEPQGKLMGRYGNLTIKKVDLAESVEVKALILIQYFPI